MNSEKLNSLGHVLSTFINRRLLYNFFLSVHNKGTKENAQSINQLDGDFTNRHLLFFYLRRPYQRLEWKVFQRWWEDSSRQTWIYLEETKVFFTKCCFSLQIQIRALDESIETKIIHLKFRSIIILHHSTHHSPLCLSSIVNCILSEKKNHITHWKILRIIVWILTLLKCNLIELSWLCWIWSTFFNRFVLFQAQEYNHRN